MPDPFLLFAGQGGGAWGAYPAGALFEYFMRGGKSYEGGYGVSVNALNVCQLMAVPKSGPAEIPSLAAQTANTVQLVKFWRGVKKSKDIYVPWRATGLISAAIGELAGEYKDLAVAAIRNKESVYHTAPLWDLLQKALKDRKWHKDVCVGVVSLEKGTLEEVSLETEISGKLSPLEAIRASAAIPVYFQQVNGYYDGGATDMTPLKKVFEQFREQRRQERAGQAVKRPHELHVYRCSAFPKPKPGNYTKLFDVLKRTISILVNNTDRDDFERAHFINELMQVVDVAMVSGDVAVRDAFQPWEEKYGKVDVYVIGPSDEDMASLPSDSHSFDSATIESGLKRGQARMLDFLANKERYRLENVLGTTPAVPDLVGIPQVSPLPVA